MSRNNSPQHPCLCGGLFVLLGSVSCATLSWLMLALVDFAYPWFYEVLAIDQHIEYYSPLNRFKPYLHLADKAEHLRLFSQINHAVLHEGQGLETIAVADRNGLPLGELLRAPEILHLNDVAHLLSGLKPWAYASVFVWLCLCLAVWRKWLMPPTMKQQGVTLLLAVLSGLIVIGLFGAETVFNQLHVWIFPAGHPWYFFYEDSLMSTMMKAPDLFLAIAALWGLLTAILYAGFSHLLIKLFWR